MRLGVGRAWGWVGIAVLAGIAASNGGRAWGQGLPQYNFSRPETVRAWHATHDVAPLEPSAEGMVIKITGSDPYITGPVGNYPAGRPLWMRVRLKSERDGMLQVFYFDRAPSEAASVRVAVRGGDWQEIPLPMPALGPNYHLRIDPPGDGGQVVLARINFAPRVLLQPPAQWPKPEAVTLLASAIRIASGELALGHRPDELGGFVVEVGGKAVGCGVNRSLIGYVAGEQQRWIDLKSAAKVEARMAGGAIAVSATATDADGGVWRIAQRFAPGAAAGTIDVETQVTVSAPRAVTYLPLLFVAPGLGSFGTGKTAALFPGLEYLDKDEPSSSEADIIGPGSKRQIPDALKITFPLMTVAADGRYVGLIWRQEPTVGALFDSPDRIFGSGGHVMGLVFPGSDGPIREEGSIMPLAAEILAANQPLRAAATIIAGQAKSVTAAVQQYVSLRGLPPAPDAGLDLKGYVALAAGGWLDSKIREGSRFRHAYPGNFAPHPAADAAMLMDWLGERAGDAALAGRLKEMAGSALKEVPVASYNSAAVSHVRYPTVSLMYGGVAENARVARQHGLALLGRFEPDGSVKYRAGAVDYGKTHFAPDANGLTGQLVMSVLEAAVVSGDEKLIAEGLRLLKALDKFADTAPRGAQTWECPLHTPDILASAQLVRAYTLGYQLTGDGHWLEMARYWAWTGVPFTYLVNPAGKPAGPYATIAVYGATSWVAPNWMGLPVQWCGLVYADALYQLALLDGSGPWKQLADGITASGIQQTFPLSHPDRKGLLPDSFNLRTATRNDPAINPGTVQAPAVRLYQQPALYSFHALRGTGLLVHAPGSLAEVKEEGKTASFKVQPAKAGAYWVLVSRCKTAPQVKINGAAPAAGAVEHLATEGWLIVKLEGAATVEVGM